MACEPESSESAGGSGFFKGYLLILLAATFWATSGTLMKYLVQRYDLPPLLLAFCRDFITFFCVLVVLIFRKPSLVRIEPRDFPFFALMGATSIGLHHAVLVHAFVLLDVAVATVLNYTAPAFVVLFSWLLLREPLTKVKIAALGLTFAGCVLVAEAYNPTHLKLDLVGLLLGLGAGATYGAYSLFSKYAVQRYSFWTVLLYAFGFGALTILLYRPDVALALAGARGEVWLGVAALGLVSTLGGYAFYTAGLKFLPVGPASIVVTIELLIAACLAFVVLGEMIDFLQIIGGALIVSGVVLVSSRT
ncbi:MAG: DMT family transporter [Anaerolineae bacterium]